MVTFDVEFDNNEGTVQAPFLDAFINGYKMVASGKTHPLKGRRNPTLKIGIT